MGIDAWIAGLPGGSLARPAAGRLRVAGAGALAAEMQSLVDDVRRRLRAARSRRARGGPGAWRRARETGIAVGAQPQLTGPGGEKP